MTTPTMQMSDLLVMYLSTRQASPRYRESLRRTVRQAKAAGITDVHCFKPEAVNRFLANLSTGITTRQNVRRELLTLWRWAFEEGMTDTPPLRVMRIRSRRQPVRAWSLEDLRQIVEVAERDRSSTGGRHSRPLLNWLPAWLAIGYDTGLRLSDLLALTSRNVCRGAISTVASKTGKPLVRSLSDYSQNWATRLIDDSPDGTLFAWFLTRRRAILCVRKFLDKHGYEGSTKYLRRTCATYVEQERPGEAWRYLQHSTPDLIAKHYVDQSLFSTPSGPPAIK